MKKTLLISALAIAAIALAFTNVNASNRKDANPKNANSKSAISKNANSPSSKAVLAVYQNFPQARLVLWRQDGKLQVALFKEVGCTVRAVFTKNGRLLTTFITGDASTIPFKVQMLLKQKYPGYEPQSVTEHLNTSEDDYYVLLKNQQGNQINWMRIKTDEEGNSVDILEKLHQTM